ncbi:MAG: CRISPR-associated endonuclease Cas2 [Candidatus Izemoplasmatales bacterium]|jgi:CRISPR-associated protein Cas2
MMMLISYDVNTMDREGRKRLRRIAKECVNYGQRVQKSLFECLVTPLQFRQLKQKLESIAHPQYDSIRYYRLGSEWKSRVDKFGEKVLYDPEGEIIV